MSDEQNHEQHHGQHVDENFEKVESGASDTYPTDAGSIKKGGLMVIKGRPCRVKFHINFF